MASLAKQTGIRQSARKMRLVIDEIRGRDVNDAYARLKFSKKHAARQIEKVLRSAVANAEQDAAQQNEAFDVDRLYVSHAVVNEGATLWRYKAAAYGRPSPIRKRTSTVQIELAAKEE